MRADTLALLACPVCHRPLDLRTPASALILEAVLFCDRCQLSFPVVEGIPHFVQPSELDGSNRRFAHLYDWFSTFYRLFSRLAFAYIGMPEAVARHEITDRLDPRGGRVLEVSIGPGVNLPYLVERQDVGEIYGLDISLGQLNVCRKLLHRKGWSAELFLGNAENLPFADNTFESVFHVGGINFFNDQRAALLEMIRVAKPGTRILVVDENEKGAQGYEKFLPGFKKSFTAPRPPVRVPVDLLPVEMEDVCVREAWKGWMYCLEFRKPWGGA